MSIGEITHEFDGRNDIYRCEYTFSDEEAEIIANMSEEEYAAFKANLRDRIQYTFMKKYRKEYQWRIFGTQD